MTIKEQLKRIIKVAPYFPFKTLTGISILFFGIPIILTQFFDSVTTHWIETTGTLTDHKAVQDRIKNDEVEYFYSIGYEFQADGKKNTIFVDRGFSDKSVAERELNSELNNPPTSINFWYDKSDPSRVILEMEYISWPVYIGVLAILILLLLYFRWLMLKFYELEIEENN
jgi:hypothetical protein